MAWTKATQVHCQREALRYASDLADAGWRLIERVMQTFPRGCHNAVIQGWLAGCQTRHRVDDLQTSD